MATDLNGTKVLGYHITTLIAHGGMGSVWLAEHPHLGSRKAIKVIDPILARDPELVQRFVQEAQTPVQLDHPNPRGPTGVK